MIIIIYYKLSYWLDSGFHRKYNAGSDDLKTSSIKYRVCFNSRILKLSYFCLKHKICGGRKKLYNFTESSINPQKIIAPPMRPQINLAFYTPGFFGLENSVIFSSFVGGFQL